MKKFEYKWVTWSFPKVKWEQESKRDTSIKQQLDDLGDEGWELICVLEHERNKRTFYFKKEVV